MKILVDMGLPPAWCDLFKHHEIDALHWSVIGNPKAKDQEILAWARQHQDLLNSGALVVIDPAGFRVRILPI